MWGEEGRALWVLRVPLHVVPAPADLVDQQIMLPMAFAPDQPKCVLYAAYVQICPQWVSRAAQS